MNENKRNPWTIGLTRKAEKGRSAMPAKLQEVFAILAMDMRKTGPVQGAWPNYSKLGKNRHHCHLAPKWVACWIVVDKQIRVIEVYYVGSRKDAPY